MRFLSVEQMMIIGALGGALIVVLSMLSWRKAVYAAMVIALFEGAIRKWIIPQASELVYFLKDVILLGAYLRFYFFPEPEVRAKRLDAPYLFVGLVAVMLIVTGALNPNLRSPLMGMYGLKIYFWYFPLAFMIPYLFKNEKQMTSVLFYYLLFAIPICLLGAVQFLAGSESWLNVYARSAFEEMKHVATFGANQSDIARISGTFSYISGLATFLQFFFVLALGLLIGLSGWRRQIVSFVVIPLLLANGLMAGSRGAVFSMLICGLAVVSVSSVTKVGAKKGTMITLVMAIVATGIGISVFFEKALTAFETRRKHAGDTTIGRMMFPVNSVLDASKRVDIVGFGIGTSHPATMALRSALHIPSAKEECPVYDAETGQVLAELGWFGFIIWYAMRVLIVYQCWEAFRRSPPSLFKSLALGIFCYQLLLLPGSFILNHTANLFACAGWGFCLTPNLSSFAKNSGIRGRKKIQPGSTTQAVKV